LCELMQSGVTTVCDLFAAREDWLDTLGASGMRVYAAPMFRSGGWYTPIGHEVCVTPGTNRPGGKGSTARLE
jgi:5-methylthioadenosine/S-adenosylhomocysteine deaminase